MAKLAFEYNSRADDDVPIHVPTHREPRLSVCMHHREGKQASRTQGERERGRERERERERERGWA